MLQKKKLVLAVALATAVAAPSAFATTGYFSHGYSMKEKALAGTGVAYAQDALAAATNPAGMVMVGDRIDVGIALFSPDRRYTTTSGNPVSPSFGVNPIAGGTEDSEKTQFFVPQFGYNKMLASDRSFGFSLYANGGMNTRYENSNTYWATAFGGDGTTGVDLSQLFFAFTYAQKITNTSSWGVTPIIAYQRFKAYGLQAFDNPFYSTSPGNVTNRGYDDSWGWGAKLGIQGEVAPGLSLGASYQSEMKMGKFEKYKGLFAEGGDFDIPATANIGLAWKATPSSVLTLDAGRIWYSKVNSVGNKFDKIYGCPVFGGTDPQSCLGGSNGAGFGWKDINVYRVGYQWQTADWTWRVGYIQNDQPIPSSEVLFNILAPGVQKQHFTFGFTKQMDKSSDVTFAAMYSPEEKVKGTNPLDSTGQTIELKMKQYELGVAWSMKF